MGFWEARVTSDIGIEVLPLPAFTADAHGVLIATNEPWRRLTGRDAGRSLTDAMSAEDGARIMHAISEAGMGEPLHVEVHLSGGALGPRTFDCVLRVLPPSRKAVYLGVCYDVTGVLHERQRLTFIATHDSLTGLPNRWMFEETLKRAVIRSARGEPAVVMMMDVDNFKAYNDTFGHLQGDQALVNLGLLLQTHLRASDLLARFGGDEFAVLLEGSGMQEAREVAERMREAASEEFVEGARASGLGVSIGIARISGVGVPADVLEAADAALYEAKQEGRGRVVTA